MELGFWDFRSRRPWLELERIEDCVVFLSQFWIGFLSYETLQLFIFLYYAPKYSYLFLGFFDIDPLNHRYLAISSSNFYISILLPQIA